MSIIVIQPETLNKDAYYRAVEKLADKYKSKGKDWIDNSRERLFDVQYLGQVQKGKQLRDKYSVAKNQRLDKSITKLTSYTIYVSGLWSWCQCSIARDYALRLSTGKQNIHIHQVCTHVGAVMVFRFYMEELFRC